MRVFRFVSLLCSLFICLIILAASVGASPVANATTLGVSDQAKVASQLAIRSFPVDSLSPGLSQSIAQLYPAAPLSDDSPSDTSESSRQPSSRIWTWGFLLVALLPFFPVLLRRISPPEDTAADPPAVEVDSEVLDDAGESPVSFESEDKLSATAAVPMTQDAIWVERIVPSETAPKPFVSESDTLESDEAEAESDQPTQADALLEEVIEDLNQNVSDEASSANDAFLIADEGASAAPIADESVLSAPQREVEPHPLSTESTLEVELPVAEPAAAELMTEASAFESAPEASLTKPIPVDLTNAPLVDVVILADSMPDLQFDLKALSDATANTMQRAIARRPAHIRLTWLGMHEVVESTGIDQIVHDYLSSKCGVSTMPATDQIDAMWAIKAIAQSFDWRETSARAVFYIGCDATNATAQTTDADVERVIQVARQAGVIIHAYTVAPEAKSPTEHQAAMVQLVQATGGLAFTQGAIATDISSVFERLLDNSCRRCGHRRLVVDSRQDCYSLNQAQVQRLQSATNSVMLTPGDYAVRIQSGSFSYAKQPHQFDAEPWVVLWLQGGQFINKQTNIKATTTWTTLNGYHDVLMLQVLEPTTLCGLFFDTFKDDNQGKIMLSVLNMTPIPMNV
jgi:hypothetical protein